MSASSVMADDVGIVQPSDEQKKVIDIVVEFVISKGKSFEQNLVLQNNPDHAFLKPGNVFHAYYQQKLRDIRKKAEQNTTTEAVAVTEAPKKDAPVEPPPRNNFAFEPPDMITPLQLDTMKLSAQFVARNGTPFLTNLVNREARNPRFMFLQQGHPLNLYFQRLVESYAHVLNPRGIVDAMKEGNTKKAILERIMKKAYWLRAQKKAAENAKRDEKIREAIGDIDWKEFVVVETVILDDTESFLMNYSTAITDSEPASNPMETEPVVDNKPVVRDELGTYKPAKKANNVKCPICSQLIPMAEFDEHFKIEKSRGGYNFQNKKQEGPSVYAGGDEIVNNLQRLSDRRAQMEAMEAEDEKKKQEGKVIWDGHSSSIAKAKKESGQMPSMPSMPSMPQYTTQPSPLPTPLYPPPMPMSGMGMAPPPGFMPMGGMGMAPPPGFMPMGGMGMAPPPGWGQGGIADGPPMKKQKMGDTYSEAEWITMHPNPIKLTIQVAAEGKSTQVSLSLLVSESVKTLKDKLQEETKIAANKQNLKVEGLGFLKDKDTLAQYNIESDTTIQLTMKERGGRKK